MPLHVAVHRVGVDDEEAAIVLDAVLDDGAQLDEEHDGTRGGERRLLADEARVEVARHGATIASGSDIFRVTPGGGNRTDVIVAPGRDTRRDLFGQGFAIRLLAPADANEVTLAG